MRATSHRTIRWCPALFFLCLPESVRLSSSPFLMRPRLPLLGSTRISGSKLLCCVLHAVSDTLGHAKAFSWEASAPRLVP